MANRKINIENGSTRGRKKNWLLYGGLAIAGAYLLRKVPALRTIAFPVIATKAAQYFRGKMQAA